MTGRRVCVVAAAMLCVMSLGAGSARGQGSFGSPEWMLVASANLGGASAIFFFDATHATVANAGVLYYLGPSDPDGLKWDESNEPVGVTHIRQIRLIQGILYAASAGTDVLVSSDSGQTWTYSGLNLVNANDVYADGTGKIRMLTDPMEVFARLDTMHCIAQGNAQIFTSIDGGETWTYTGVPMVDSSSFGAFADRCYNVYVCPNSWGTVFRSTDFGEDWQTVPTASGTGSEYLNGASTVIYLSSELGMFRSIDDGVDWVSVITAQGYTYPLAVWGPIGENVVGYGAWGVWSGFCLTTTGGLDDLHSAPSMTDSNGAPLAQQDTMNVPMEMASTCRPFLIPITVESDVDSMSVSVSIADDSLGDFFFPPKGPILLRKGHEDTLWMQYDPHHPVANVVLSFDSHWHCSDWTETRSVHVDAFPNAAINPPPVFAASCVPDTEAALIRLDSCDVLCIDSVEFPPSLAANLRVVTTLPDTMILGSSDSLLFAFTSAGMSGTITDSIVIYAHYIGLDSLFDDYFYFPHAWGDDTDFSLFYTTVPITLKRLEGIALFTADTAISLHRASYCEHELDTVVAFKNKGCTPDTITQAVLSGSGYSIPPITLPIIVPPDSAVNFSVTFVGPDTGVFPGSLDLIAASGTSDTLVVSLAGRGFPNSGVLAVNSAAFDVGSAYLCEERDTFAVIQDTACDSVCVSSVSLAGTGFRMVGADSGAPFCLAPGASDTIRITTQIDTSGHPASNNATLIISSDAVPPLPPIVLSREIEYPVGWSIHVSPSQSSTAGTRVTYQLNQSGTLPADVTELDFTLSYNDDLLSFVSADEASVDTTGVNRTSDGMAHLTFHISPVSGNPILATLHFLPRVARDSQSAILLSNIEFVSSLGRPSDCVASVDADGSSFTLQLECGTNALAQLLQSGTISIENIDPNPATGNITISVYSDADARVSGELSLLDAIGRNVIEANVALQSGENRLPLNLTSLPNGIYSVRLNAGGHFSVKGFAKE